jgi:hypothetical protein
MKWIQISFREFLPFYPHSIIVQICDELFCEIKTKYLKTRPFENSTLFTYFNFSMLNRSGSDVGNQDITMDSGTFGSPK